MQNLLASILIFRNPSIGIHVHLPMKEYKKLDLKNDNGATNLVHYLNEGWDIFREFPGWIIIFRDKKPDEGPLFQKLSKILSRPEVETMTIEQFEVLWNEAGGNLNASVSPAAEPEKPVFRPHREWFEMLKEPLRSQALDALGKFPLEEKISSSMSEAFSAAFSWKGVGEIDKWGGVYDFFEGRGIALSDSEYNAGYALAKQCAPDGWEQQGAGE